MLVAEAKKLGYSMTDLSRKLGYNDSYLSLVLRRGKLPKVILDGVKKGIINAVPELNKEKAGNAFELKQQLLITQNQLGECKQHAFDTNELNSDIAELNRKLQDKQKALDGAIKAKDMQQVAFNELEKSYLTANRELLESQQAIQGLKEESDSYFVERNDLAKKLQFKKNEVEQLDKTVHNLRTIIFEKNKAIGLRNNWLIILSIVLVMFIGAYGYVMECF